MNPKHQGLVLQGAESIQSWKRRHPKSHLDLRGASLRRATLERADLAHADLRHADLEWADLRWADLIGANLIGAKLARADLFKADLLRANLEGADLRKANLEDANLNRARLSGALFGDTRLISTDLGGARNLSETRHLGPSILDEEVLAKSPGLPFAFLRGCGLPEWRIRETELLDSSAPSDRIREVKREVVRRRRGPEHYSAFISHSHIDNQFAGRLEDALQARDIRCWLDDHQLLPGDDISEEVDQGVRLWDKLLLCCSEASLSRSWWVDSEIERAFEKERQLMRERGKKVLVLIPLDLDGFLRSDRWKSGKRSEILSRVAANFLGWDRDPRVFARQIELIERALRADRSGKELPPASRV